MGDKERFTYGSIFEVPLWGKQEGKKSKGISNTEYNTDILKCLMYLGLPLYFSLFCKFGIYLQKPVMRYQRVK